MHGTERDPAAQEAARRHEKIAEDAALRERRLAHDETELAAMERRTAAAVHDPAQRAAHLRAAAAHTQQAGSHQRDAERFEREAQHDHRLTH